MADKNNTLLENAKKDLKLVWTNIGKKLADISGDEVKQKEYLINDIVNRAKSWEKLEVKDRDLSGVDFSGKTISDVKFINCNLNGANFSDTKLFKVEFENTNANNSNFKNANFLDSKMKMSSFDNANFEGFSFGNISLKESPDIYTCSFKTANMAKAYIGDIYIDNSNFTNSDLNNISLYGSNIVRCDFRGANLDNSGGSRTEFTNCDLRDTVGEFKVVDDQEKVDIENDYDLEQTLEYIKNDSDDYEFENDYNKFANALEDLFEHIEYGNNHSDDLDFDEDDIDRFEKEMENTKIEIIEYLDNGDYKNAYEKAKYEAGYDDKKFVDNVIVHCGTDINTINSMVNAMVICKGETDEYGAKLLSDVLNSDTYKEAKFNSEYSKSQIIEVGRVSQNR